MLCGRTVDVPTNCVLNIICRSAVTRTCRRRETVNAKTNELQSVRVLRLSQRCSRGRCSTFRGSLVVSSARVEMSNEEWTLRPLQMKSPCCLPRSTNRPTTRRHILEEQSPEFGSISEMLWAGIAQSVLRLAAGWTVRGSNSGGRRDFPHPSRPALGPTQPPVRWVPALSRG